jgi:hypothetical protein
MPDEPQKITDHKWRRRMVFEPAQKELGLHLLCGYMNCRRPRNEHAPAALRPGARR